MVSPHLRSVRTWVVAICIAFAAALSGFGADVAVKGYTKKDGTVVPPYVRTAPNSTKNDNYSTQGNINPYTGKAGTKPGDAGKTASGNTTQAPKAPSTSPAQSATGPRPAADLSAWSKLHLAMTSAEVIALVGEPNLKTAQKWVYTAGGSITFDTAGKVIGLTLPAGASTAQSARPPPKAPDTSSPTTRAPASDGSVRPGIQASGAETAQATALLRAGWEYIMPRPKSAQAAWGNKDGRTTWFHGYWKNSQTGATSFGVPVQEGTGFRGDGAAVAGAWSNGGAPSVSKLQWLASKDGGPPATLVR